ncbi:hypothetical protein L596_005453 [Steinernema carpocapsae]|uniref:Uncharacterized protein n=1 Tax=Steinernema carpocapsae TaxID=34508 RepID=A0A4U8UZB2_STECR|nr:hypothetical protein L596_005453 [Steinernema carpocapsae]
MRAALSQSAFFLAPRFCSPLREGRPPTGQPALAFLAATDRRQKQRAQACNKKRLSRKQLGHIGLALEETERQRAFAELNFPVSVSPARLLTRSPCGAGGAHLLPTRVGPENERSLVLSVLLSLIARAFSTLRTFILLLPRLHLQPNSLVRVKKAMCCDVLVLLTLTGLIAGLFAPVGAPAVPTPLRSHAVSFLGRQPPRRRQGQQTKERRGLWWLGRTVFVCRLPKTLCASGFFAAYADLLQLAALWKLGP